MLNVSSYKVINNEMDFKNPLSVGNGDLCLTVDVTGLQTFFEYYNFIPLTFMSNLLWHGKRTDENKFIKTKYSYNGNARYYMTNKEGQEKLYDNLRMNPFKFNFCHFILTFNNKKINKEDIKSINQYLDIQNGIIHSKFELYKENVYVKTSINEDNQQVNFTIKSSLLNKGLEVSAVFSYPSPLKKGYIKEGNYSLNKEENSLVYQVDSTIYRLFYKTNGINNITDKEVSFKGKDILELSFYFDKYEEFKPTLKSFWDKLEISFIGDELLDRRMVLSAYLLKINCSGTYPPAETGLTYNSWHSKFHLEMHPWHMLWSIAYGASELLEKSLPYYLDIQESSVKRALSQGYKGLRFPKMTDPTGFDSPSNIGTLLLWQQPHLIYMLEELYKKTNRFDIITKYQEVVFKSIEFLESFLVFKDNEYHLDRPLICAQENHPVSLTLNPLFEVEYVRFSFKLANLWNERLGLDSHKYDKYIEKLVKPNVYQDVYEAHWGTNETYTKYNQDHPISIGAYSFFISEALDKNIVLNTLNKILKTWDLSSSWGWDFPMLALCALNLGDVFLAIDILKMDEPKNTYLKNGHNMQGQRDDLTIYLPGNGAFLLAFKKLQESLEEKMTNKAKKIFKVHD